MKKQLAICGGEPLRKRPFFQWPVWDQREEKAVLGVLHSGRWGHTMTPADCARAFEQQFAGYYGVKYAVTCTNGSVALEVALRTLKIGPGDEVITPPTTWVATNLAPVMVGADPVFVDISPANYCLDPERLEAAITRKTKAVIVVHVAGFAADMDGIMQVARRRKLPVIEDCAQAHGTRYKGRLVGTIGDFGCFSFEQSKLMTAGEGGMVITNNDAWGRYVFSLCNARMAYGNRGYYFPENGRMPAWNQRMTEFQAALLSIQLERLEPQRVERIRNAEYLRSRLVKIEGIRPMSPAPGQNIYSYLFKYAATAFGGAPVTTFRQALRAEGIPLFSSPSDQPPAYRSPAFYSPRRDYAGVCCPEAEKAFSMEAVGIQGRAFLGTRKDMDAIARAVAKIKTNARELAAWKAAG